MKVILALAEQYMKCRKNILFTFCFLNRPFFVLQQSVTTRVIQSASSIESMSVFKICPSTSKCDHHLRRGNGYMCRMQKHRVILETKHTSM